MVSRTAIFRTAIASVDRTPSSSVGLSCRAVHPSNQSQRGLSVNDLAGALSFEALRAIATGFAQAQPIEPIGEGDRPLPSSGRLLATSYYDVWLITWPDGSSLEAHDHGGARSVLHVVDGELDEIVADHADTQPPRGRTLRHGETVCAQPSFVHDLANRSGVPATTLHVYSPPLAEVTFFDVRLDGECGRLRTATVPERTPRASSDDSSPHRSSGLRRVVI